MSTRVTKRLNVRYKTSFRKRKRKESTRGNFFIDSLGKLQKRKGCRRVTLPINARFRNDMKRYRKKSPCGGKTEIISSVMNLNPDFHPRKSRKRKKRRPSTTCRISIRKLVSSKKEKSKENRPHTAPVITTRKSSEIGDIFGGSSFEMRSCHVFPFSNSYDRPLFQKDISSDNVLMRGISECQPQHEKVIFENYGDPNTERNVPVSLPPPYPNRYLPPSRFIRPKSSYVKSRPKSSYARSKNISTSEMVKDPFNEEEEFSRKKRRNRNYMRAKEEERRMKTNPAALFEQMENFRRYRDGEKEKSDTLRRKWLKLEELEMEKDMEKVRDIILGGSVRRKYNVRKGSKKMRMFNNRVRMKNSLGGGSGGKRRESRRRLRVQSSKSKRYWGDDEDFRRYSKY